MVDTSKSFAVSAWVRLGSKSAKYVALSQVGTSTEAFSLRYQPAGGLAYSDRWVFEVTNSDAACADPCAAWWRAYSTSVPAVGRWTHIAVSYDQAAGQIAIYVNGALEGTASGVTAWSATGQTRIGKGFSAGFNGQLADAQFWQRTLFDTEVRAAVDQLDNGNTGQWHFNEVYSTPQWDSTMYMNDLNLEGNVSVPASGAGHDGTGMSFPNGTGWAETLEPVVYTDQSFTVSAWAYLTDGSRNRTVIAQDGQYDSAFALKYDAVAGGKWTMQMFDYDDLATTTGPTASSTSAPLNTWTQLTGVYDAPAGQIRLYVNGALVASTPFTQSWRATGAFTVGRSKWQGNETDHWVGYVDEVRAYAGVVPQMAGDWRFNSCTGAPTSCTDAIANHPVTLTTGATWTAAGFGGTSGLALNGSGAATTSVPILNTTKSFTVSAWVYLTDGTANRTVVSQDGATQAGFYLQYQSANGGRWAFGMRDKDTTTGVVTEAVSTSAALNTWTHLVGVADVLTGQIRLYVNGDQVDARTFNPSWNATGSLTIGRMKLSGANSAYWLGTVDEVRTYQGVLSDVRTMQ
ncbi:LamG domain-containing protein [Luedemannella flava]